MENLTDFWLGLQPPAMAFENFTVEIEPPWRNQNLSRPSRQPFNEFNHLGMVEVVIDRYVIPTICVIGFLGNVINLLVLTRARFRQNEAVGETGAQIGLVILSVSDLLFCVVTFPRCLVRSTHSLFDSLDFRLYYQAYGTGLVTTFILTSTWITVTMAMLRYFGICHPLRSRKFIGVSFARAAYSTVILVCFAFNLPIFWQYVVTDMPIDENTTYYLLDIGYMDFTTTRGMTFQWLRVIYGVFIPAVLLIFCNCSLVLALKRSYRMRKQCYVKENASNSRNRVTLTLVTIVTSFIILVFPSEAMDFFIDRIKMDSARTEIFLLARAVANALQVTNFACNFFLYCSVNSQFRSTFQHLLNCRGRGRLKRGRKHSSLHIRLNSTAVSGRSTVSTEI